MPYAAPLCKFWKSDRCIPSLPCVFLLRIGTKLAPDIQTWSQLKHQHCDPIAPIAMAIWSAVARSSAFESTLPRQLQKTK
ncbi:hypothetical protein DOTSEDRAFT_75487 [Dothistroma septosporum NZE10]|uniref:Uncharacterized protein n=1 Tax=Dothistroma septosporum (strain NZE10 / CBS 128990) TaxID=675120 RepID=M2YIM2_DOTSN|nr:hypothetical protein DOTSEDRAFT_75487 [Dothistroma septosporum NZE10]